jgi:putative Ca2+/H+ antiporter (TMEM165/GDT1 family)
MDKAMLIKLVSIFVAIFVAELGDKTQLATLLFATDRTVHPGLIFLAATAALTLSTGLAVLIGSYGAKYLDMVPLKPIGGGIFIAIGIWMIGEHILK